MGNNQQEAYAEGVREGWTTLRQAVSAALASNHYPPIPQEYVSPVLEAITACNDGMHGDDIDITVVKPTGMIPKLAHVVDTDGTLVISAADLVEITHSWAFTEGFEEDAGCAQDEDEQWGRMD